MKLAIITGITGKLGNEYLRCFLNKEDFKCIGMTRREPPRRYANTEYLFSDLLDRENVAGVLKSVDFNAYSEIIFIHPIGMFKFEMNGIPKIDKDKDGIDDEIFASNVLTFTHIFDFIKKSSKKNDIPLTVCAFGSITDKYDIPFWRSYTKSKNKVRKIIKKSTCGPNKIKGVFINVSTADTSNEQKLRPFAKRTYWLKPKEIVDSSMSPILKSKHRWVEMNLYKPNPQFDYTWYTNHENVLERWKMQMGEK